MHRLFIALALLLPLATTAQSTAITGKKSGGATSQVPLTTNSALLVGLESGTITACTQATAANLNATVAQGAGAAVASAWPVEMTDGTNTATVKAASTAPAATDTTIVVGQNPNGGNPCQNPSATLVSATGSTSGTSAVQIVALSAGKKIYLCSLSVVGVSGTTPTFSLVQGTGTNCGTGQTVVVQAWTTAAGTIYIFAPPVAVGASANALCYLDTGTTPVQRYTLTYIQQ